MYSDKNNWTQYIVMLSTVQNLKQLKGPVLAL